LAKNANARTNNACNAGPSDQPKHDDRGDDTCRATAKRSSGSDSEQKKGERQDGIGQSHEHGIEAAADKPGQESDNDAKTNGQCGATARNEQGEGSTVGHARRNAATEGIRTEGICERRGTRHAGDIEAGGDILDERGMMVEACDKDGSKRQGAEQEPAKPCATFALSDCHPYRSVVVVEDYRTR